MTTQRTLIRTRRTGAVLAAAAAVAATAGCGGDSQRPASTVAATTAKPAVAKTTAVNGRIVYAKEVRGNFQLFTVGPDGKGETRLTQVDGDAVHPDWSPDGERIVFEFDHKHAKPRPYCSIAIVNAAGTELIDFDASRRGCDNQPAFAPDGRSIVFVHYDDVKDVERIATMSTTGGDRRDIPSPWRNGVTDPNMSPDGDRITFVHMKRPEKLQALFSMHPDGSELHRLTPYSWEVAIKHDWSPDGRLIALTTNADFVKPGASANLVTIRTDGAASTRLTRFTGARKNAFAGSFSPDGEQIVMRLEDGDKSSLAVVDRDGRNLRSITKPGPDRPRFIDWGTGSTPTQSQAAKPKPGQAQTTEPEQAPRPKPVTESVSGGGED